MCWDITEADRCESLKSPMESNEVLFSNTRVIVVRTSNPASFLEAREFIQVEPEARNQMSQEDDWAKNEDDLSNGVTKFKSFWNTGEFSKFKNSKQLEQPKDSKQPIHSW